MSRIKKTDIQRQIDDQITIWGYERFHIEHRYNYYAIDEMDKPRPAMNPAIKCMVQDCRRTYRVGLSLKQAYEIVDALIQGATTMK